ncbi:hypothetical protein AW736_26335 [Termitidicoccus mucosus]|uniref:Uncharacterized protein n=2 Tax=Termitidicoccus mucosus TaxID=1184151 RepID=A0A178IQ78_9BACT|nr:hypothetical protein AW736_26335 [Opitutaceae bacterium TSB47]
MSKLVPSIRPDKDQLDFFREIAAVTGNNYTNTLEFYSSLPAILFDAGHADTSKPYRKIFTYGNEQFTLIMKPTNIVRKGDVVRQAFPGQREGIVREVVTKMAIDSPDILHQIKAANQTKVELRCSLSRIRARCIEAGHGWKLEEIHEALQILSECRIEIKQGSVRISPEVGLLGYGYGINETDSERSLAVITFHPLFIGALRKKGYRQIHYGRLMQLKHPLARWTYQRMSHYYTTVEKGFFGFSSAKPYNISLKFILENSTMTRYVNLRNNVRECRQAWADMLRCGILTAVRDKEKHGYDEEIRYDTSARGRGRKPIIDAVWDLWISGEVVEDMIVATQKTKKLVDSEKNEST